MNTKDFLPWRVWINQPAQKGLEYTDLMRKYDIERHQYLQRQTFIENQENLRKK